MNFETISKLNNKVYKAGLRYCDLWPTAKEVEFKYDTRDDAVKERIEILTKALTNLKLGKMLKMVFHKVT